MGANITLSAIVTGFPARLIQPKPLPGETLVGVVIRNYPQQWRNFIERLAKDFRLPRNTYDRLLIGKPNISDLSDPKIEEQFDEFITYRLPNHSRTLKSLADLQRHMKDPFEQQVNGFTMVEIICPRQRDPNGDTSFEQFATKMGAKVIWISSSAPRSFDLSSFLPHIASDFVWLVPGGTRFMASSAIPSLRRVLTHLDASSKRAFYTDNADSFIYRTTSLQELARKGKNLTADSREMARMLQGLGYEFVVDKNPDAILCELEREYGGLGQGKR